MNRIKSPSIFFFNKYFILLRLHSELSMRTWELSQINSLIFVILCRNFDWIEKRKPNPASINLFFLYQNSWNSIKYGIWMKGKSLKKGLITLSSECLHFCYVFSWHFQTIEVWDGKSKQNQHAIPDLDSHCESESGSENWNYSMISFSRVACDSFFHLFSLFHVCSETIEEKNGETIEDFLCVDFQITGKKTNKHLFFSALSRRYCVMQFCLCCTNKGSQVLCTWQWISLSHWMDAMMT